MHNTINLPNGNIIKNVNEIGKLLREKRKKLSLTQKETAEMCNTGIRFLSDLENGKPTLQIDKVIKVLNNFGFDLIIMDRSKQ